MTTPAVDAAGALRALRPLLAIIRPHLRLLAIAIASGVLSQLLFVVNGGLAAYLVGRAFVGAEVSELRPYVFLLVVSILAQATCVWAESLLAHIAAFRALSDVRRRCYGAFERLSPGHLNTRRSGDVGATTMDDVELLELFFSHTLGPLVSATVVPGLTVVGLLILAWPAALVLLPFVIGVASVPRWLRRRAAAEGTAERTQVGLVNAELVDVVQGAREVAALGAEQAQLGVLRRRGGLLKQAQVAHARRTGIEKAAVDLLAAIGVLAVIVTAALLVNTGRLEPALLPACVVLAAGAFAPVALFTEAARELGRVAAGSARVHDLISRPAPIVDRVEVTPPAGEPVVRFVDVTFRYAPDLPDAVAAVSFEIRPGETVALVGASGAGKSTCAALLLRMYDVDSGRLTIGGVDVREMPQDHLREQVALVPQDVYLFSRTVRDNLVLGRPAASERAVRAAGDAAIMTGYVEQLPEGFDTRVGERGVRLSGGQRQRLAVGRALLRDTPVLVFDEATSSLDADNEAAMRTAIARATDGRTTLVIAHRLSTIRAADRLVVLDRGRVVETGTFDELVAAGGHFAALVRVGFESAPER